MQQAWYRKYRPKSFGEVVGQDHIKTTLLNQVKTDKIGHAYLFAGPKGTGKTSLARILARAVNCLEPKAGEPCGKCSICQAFNNHQMIDLIEIDAASHTGVDNIRELISQINLAPSLGKYKVYVIDEAHMLSKGAFNALLKTLEEPPAHAIFVLATTEPHKFPATIISRCQRFDFRYLAVGDIADFLANVAKQEKIKIDQAAILFLAEQSEGSLRDGLSLLEQAASMGSDITKDKMTRWLGFVDWATVHQLTKLLVAGDAKQTITMVNQLYLDGYDLTRLAESWIKFVRQLLTVKLTNPISVTDDQMTKLTQLSATLSIQQIVWLLEKIMLAAYEIKSTVIPQVPLEVMAVRAKQLFGSKDSDKPEMPPSSGSASESKPLAPKAADPQSQTMDWPQIVKRVRKVSPTLGAVLAQAQAEFVGNELVLKFSLNFYKDAFTQTSNRRILDKVLLDLGRRYTVKCLVDESAQTPASDVAIEEVFKVFGQA